MKYHSFALIVLLLVTFNFTRIHSQDTITVQTFTWDSTSRAGWFTFPDLPLEDIERINMIYNMRCHGAVVGNGQTGCREWDYSCNTFITDTTMTDSSLANHPKYIIPNFSGSAFKYSNSPTSGCIAFQQTRSAVDQIENKKISALGQANQTLNLLNNNQKMYLLYSKDECINSGLEKGLIHALRFHFEKDQSKFSFLKIKMKNILDSELSPQYVSLDNMQEVFFSDVDIATSGITELLLKSPFPWDGVSNLLIELSYNTMSGNNNSLLGDNTIGKNMCLTAANEQYSLLQNGNRGIALDKSKLNNISNEITVSFWSYGTSEILPVNTTAFEGYDSLNRRQVNVHLPWSNGSIYWDCGNDGSGYDRIEKPANSDEFEGKWNHWAFTKNAQTGIMNIYRNGVLWHSGTGKRKKISINQFTLGGNIDGQLSYFGRLSQFCIWNRALDSSTIKNWMLAPGDINHPYNSSLLYYFPLNDHSSSIIQDLSSNPKSIQIQQLINWSLEKGRNIITGLKTSVIRPSIQFVQGTPKNLTNTSIQVLEEFTQPLTQVSEYHIQKGRAVVKQSYSVYPAGNYIIRNESNDSVGLKIIAEDGQFVLENIRYQYYSPAKFELLSLVSPYGINLDLTKDGKNFVFDVTDYAPILRGSKRMTMELGGEYQEEFNIKFQFIKGKAARPVKSIQNVYTFNRGWFGNILKDEVFEPRQLQMNPEANTFKLRTTITGHDQNGEFVPISHYLKVNGSKSNTKHDFTVWKECADNPIYPQGGTWIFDRAGWCPGAASDVHFLDISNQVEPGRSATIDYGLNASQLDAANYLVSCQLVSYGEAVYKVDAGMESIVRPNSERVEFERFNPSCSRPSIYIKNFGKDNITSITIQYYVMNGSKLEYTYTGLIKPLEIRNIDLPIDQMSFWTSSPETKFVVEIIKVNGQSDENPRNNKVVSNFKLVKSFNFDPVFELRTNNVEGDNSFSISDMNGNVLIEQTNLTANTTTQEVLSLPNGCYTLKVTDLAQDGLSFWFFPEYGNGFTSLKRKVNNSLIVAQGFKPDFGAGFQFDFIINKVNSVNNHNPSYLLSVYPNPSFGEISIEFQSTTAREVECTIVNSIGEEINEKKLIRLNDRNFEKLKIENLNPGMYILQLIVDGEKISRKVIVQNKDK